jgi:non-specific serine/threonine protein kinase
VPATPLIGRELEVASICDRLLAPGIRLLTLTGTGGGGKTRLALEVARQIQPSFPDGVCFIELGGLSEPTLVPQAVALALGVQAGPARPLLESLATALQEREILLFVDNCEHLVDACADLLDGLLRATSHLCVLATSREPLRIPAETVYPVPPLEVPDPQNAHLSDALAHYPGVQLFVERARAARPGFTVSQQNAQAIGELCGRLAGIPLAIELAAARTRVLAVPQIVERLDHSIALLSGGSRTAPSRQQTLKAALDWSFDLLSPSEQALFRRLAVFAGGFDLEAAEAVARDPEGMLQPTEAALRVSPSSVLDLLTALVDKSLVACDEHHESARYRLLEPVRQYGLEHLRASEEHDAIRRQHAGYYLALAEVVEQESLEIEQRTWFDRLEINLDNVRAALDWSRATPERGELGLRLAGALWRFWGVRGHLAEGRAWLAELLAEAPAGSPTSGRGKALFAAGWLAMIQEGDRAAEVLAAESAAICRSLGDGAGLGWALWLWAYSQRRHDAVAAQALAEESLTVRQAGDDAREIGWSHWLLGDLARIRGEFQKAARSYADAFALVQAAGPCAEISDVYRSLGQIAALQGDYPRARQLFDECLVVRRSVGDTWNIPDSFEGLAWLATMQEQAARAVRLYGAAAAIRERSGTALLGERHTRLERHLLVARQALGDARASAAWEEGRRMSVDQAIDYALASDPELGGTTPRAGPAEPGTREATLPLTARELEVAQLLARGFTNRQVAAALTITEGTAGVHVVHILNKLGLHSRWQVADWAADRGLLDE